MELKDLRSKIDYIDEKLIELFSERMELATKIGEYKRENGKPIFDPARERDKLREIGDKVPEDLRDSAEALYSLMFELSRARQRMLTAGDGEIAKAVKNAVKETDLEFPNRAMVACQGVEGAFSQQACEKLFARPGILYFNSFEGVFSAVDKGLCRYGVLPIENSTAGSVNRIYDLMMKYNFYIVRSTRVKVDHCLLANPGAELGGIREIISHEQALAQCSELIRSMPDIKVIACENTAEAARIVHESGRTDIAALSSSYCTELYDLKCLKSSVQDTGSNFTRFICISKKLEIYPGADKTSIMMVLPHRPGSLYRVLSKFNALGVNLIKLESRPLPNSDFEFMFYFDLEISVYSDRFPQVFAGLDELCTELKYLGSYSGSI